MTTLVVLGDDDPQTPADDVLGHAHDRVRIEVWPSGHLLPVRLSDRLADVVDAELLASSL